MLPDLEARLRRYVEELDEAAPPVTLDEVIDLAAPTVTQAELVASRFRWPGPRRIRWGLGIGAIAAAVVLVAVGAAALVALFAERDEVTPVTAPTSTATTTSPTSTVATATPAVLATAQAGPVPPIATCPPGSTPNQPGPTAQTRPPMFVYSAAVDRQSGRIVVFAAAQEEFGSTWTFDLCTNTWEAMHPDIEPLANWGNLVYDEDSDVVIGYFPGLGSPFWAYDLERNEWTEKGAWAAPMFIGLQLAYDPVSGLVVAREPANSLMWAYDVDTDQWTKVQQADAPPFGGATVFGFDRTADRLILHDPDLALGYTWAFDPRKGTWNKNADEAGLPEMSFGWGPPAAEGSAFDETNDRLVTASDGVVAGYDTGSRRWEVIQDTPAEPPPHTGCSLVYDPINERLVALGSVDPLALEEPERIDDVWAFDVDPREWTQLLAPTAALAGLRADGEQPVPATQPPEITELPEVVATVPMLPALSLSPVPGYEPVRLSTVVGDLEFTGLKVPEGHLLLWPASTPYGTVIVDREGTGRSLRWSTDHETWQGIPLSDDAWRVFTVGVDVVVIGGDGATRYGWDGDRWSELARLDLADVVDQIVPGSAGVLAVTGITIHHSLDGVHFTPASLSPSKDLLTAAGPGAASDDQFAGGCQGFPSYTWWDREHSIPVVAISDGFVAFTPAHPDDWDMEPICTPLLWSSADGIVWELVSGESPFGDRAFVYNVAERDGRLVAAGGVAEGRGAVWVSDDGLAWERANVDLSAAVGVVAGDLGWVVHGRDVADWNESVIWLSDDGLTWDGPYGPPGGLSNEDALTPTVTVGSDAIFGQGDILGNDVMVVGRLLAEGE